MTQVLVVHYAQIGDILYGRKRNPRVVVWHESLSVPLASRDDVVAVAEWDDGDGPRSVRADRTGGFWRDVVRRDGTAVTEETFADWLANDVRPVAVPGRMRRSVAVETTLSPGEPLDELGPIRGWNRRFEAENEEIRTTAAGILASYAFAAGRLMERCEEPVIVYSAGALGAGGPGRIALLSRAHREREDYCWRLDALEALRAEAAGLEGVGEAGFMPALRIEVARPDMLRFDHDEAEARRSALLAVNRVLQDTGDALRNRSGGYLAAFVALRDALRDEGRMDPDACRAAIDAMGWEDGRVRPLPPHFGTFLAGRGVVEEPTLADDEDALTLFAMR